jgi:hypothetical protein
MSRENFLKKIFIFGTCRLEKYFKIWFAFEFLSLILH